MRAFSGFHSPLLLLHPCPPAVLPGLPVQEQRSHLVFVWDRSRAGGALVPRMSRRQQPWVQSGVGVCAGSGFMLHLSAKASRNFSSVWKWQQLFNHKAPLTVVVHDSTPCGCWCMTRLCTKAGSDCVLSHADNGRMSGSPADLEHRRSDCIGLICDYNPNITLT